MPMPKPMPVLMEVSRFLTTAAMASRLAALILPVTTRLLISSSMACQRSGGRKLGQNIIGSQNIAKIHSALNSLSISPEPGGLFKCNSGYTPKQSAAL